MSSDSPSFDRSAGRTHRRRQRAARVTAVAMAGVAAATPPAPSPATHPGVAGKVIVVLRDQLPGLSAKSSQRHARARARAEQDAVLAALPGTALRSVTHLSVGNAFAATVTSTQAAALVANPAVASVIPDVAVVVGPRPVPPPTANKSLPGRTPNRP